MKQTRTYILPRDNPQPVSFYSHGMRVGDMLYSAGQTSRAPDGSLVGLGDVSVQTNQALTNLSHVLRDANMDWQDVVRLNVFVKSIQDLAEIMKTVQVYLQGNQPAFCAAEVKSLAYREYILEVEAIAMKRGAEE